MIKKFSLLIIFCCAIRCNVCVAQSGEWTWMKGDTAINANGIFGVLGIPDSANTPQALSGPAEWTDQQGNFWILGGTDASYSVTNAFWKFDPYSDQWTWMGGSQFCCQNGVYGIQGVADPSNFPGARSETASWTDLNGNLWLFGGSIQSGYELNDLWKYDIAANEWTWMKGSSSPGSTGSFGTLGIPSASNEPPANTALGARWTDANNNLWFFGGLSTPYPFHDVMWKYDITTNEWTWMRGSPVIYQPPVYGSKGVPSPSNTPGGRIAYGNMVDSDGNFWFFGGSPGGDCLSDLWRFNPSTLEYTWMSGAVITNDPGNYTATCIADSLNLPGARYENRASWIDENQKIWMFGGYYDIYGNWHTLNDLWFYTISTGEWTWVSGSSGIDQNAVYGVQYVADPANHPVSSGGAVAWIDKECHFWIFGGDRASLWNQFYNTMWKFIPDSLCGGGFCTTHFSLVNFSATDSALCEKFCVDFNDFSQNNPDSWQWLFPGGDPSSSTLQNPTGICYNTPGIYDVTLITNNANGSDTLTLNNFITVYATPPFPTITQVDYTLTSSAAGSYQWQLNTADIPGATNQSYTILQSGYYTVIVGDSNDCVNSITTYVLISGIGDVNGDEGISIYPNPSSGSFIVEWFNGLMAGEVAIDVMNTFGQKVFSSTEKISSTQFSEGVHSDKKEIDLTHFADGVYYITLKAENIFVIKKLMIAR